MPVYPSDLFISVKEIPGRSGTPYSASGETRYQRKFRVLCKLKGLASLAVCTAPGIPRPGAPYQSYDHDTGALIEFDLNCFLTQLSAAEQTSNDDWGTYEVTADYNSRQLTGGHPGVPGSRGHPDSQSNPTLEWPDIRWGSEQMEVVRYNDLDGFPFINSAGTIFAEAKGRMDRLSVTTLTISRNENSFDNLRAEDYAYTVNDRPFLGRKKWAVLCMPPTAESKWRGAFQYWRVSYTLKFFPRYFMSRDQFASFRIRPRYTTADANPPYETEEFIESYLNTWQPLILDAGREEYKKRPVDTVRGGMMISAKFRTPIYVNTQQVGEPVLLNGEGQQLTPDLEPAMKPYYCPFRMYPNRNLSDLLDRGFG